MGFGRWPLVIGALLLWLSPPVRADDYPSRAIRLVVPYSAGGTVDILARLVGNKLHDSLGQPVLVDNRTGAGGNLGGDLVAKADPDGYTLFVSPPGPLSINLGLYPNMPYNPLRDFAPVTLIAEVPNLLEVNPRVPATSVAALVAYAKANPGKLNFASQGSGSTTHLASELFKSRAGIDIVHVPYRGSAPALSDLVAGNVELMFDNLGSSLPFIRSGDLRALAIGGTQRSPALPDLPTFIESGFADFESTTWFAMVAPARTPPAVVARLHDATAAALTSPDILSRLADLGAVAVGSTPEALGARMTAETERWVAVIRAAKITVE